MSAAVGSRESPVPRRGVRVLVVDARDRLLLVLGADPARPGVRYWFTVGGGLEAGESEAQAAVREVHEEVGLLIEPGDLRGPVFEEVAEFPYDGVWHRQEQRFFLLRVPTWEVPAAHHDPAVLECRWWSVADLESTDETVYPPDLGRRLRGILGR